MSVPRISHSPDAFRILLLMKNAMKYYHVGAGALFLLAGLLLMIQPPKGMESDRVFVGVIGALLVAYGGFRLWRGYRGIKKDQAAGQPEGRGRWYEGAAESDPDTSSSSSAEETSDQNAQ